MVNIAGKVNRDYIEPEITTVMAREELAKFDIHNPNSLADMLPSEEVDDIEYRISYEESNDVVAADFRTFGGSFTSETWGEGKKAIGSLMPIGRNFTIDEQTYLRRRSNPDAIARSTEDLVRRAAQSIAIQVNAQRANALVHGKVELQMIGGKTRVVEFGRKPEFNTTAPKLFNDEAGDPIAYLQDLCAQYEDENGFRPETLWMSRKVEDLLWAHPKVSKLLNPYGGTIVVTGRNQFTTSAMRSALSAELGDGSEMQIRRIPTARYSVNNLTNGNVEKKNLMPQDSILLTPASGDPRDPNSSALGRTLWGRTATADVDNFDLQEELANGIVAGLINNFGVPMRQEVVADAIVMPVLWKPNYTLKAKVV